MKLCECGCGQPTTVLRKAERRNGYARGEARRFLKGHFKITLSPEGARDRAVKAWETRRTNGNNHPNIPAMVAGARAMSAEAQTRKALKAVETRRARGTDGRKPRVSVPAKRCSRCGVEKSVNGFGKDGRKWHGLKACCKACEAAASREWNRRNPGKNRATNKHWYQQHRDDQRARGRTRSAQRYLKSPHEFKVKYAKYRAKKHAATIGVVDFERIKRRDQMVCHICHRKVTDQTLAFDHVVPLSKGGDHTEQNLAVSHRVCNLSKGAKVLTLF